MRIILVEDNPQVRELLRTQVPVHWPGAVVVGEAESIAEGLDLLPRVPADLWLLDIELRDGNVFALLDSLDPALVERTALVFLTAFGDSEFILEALRKSAVEYLSKPVDFEALRLTLKKVQDRLIRYDLHGQLDNLRRLVQMNVAAVQPPLEKIPVLGRNREIRYLSVADIGYLEAKETISYVHLIASTEPIYSAKHLGHYADLLEARCGFFRLSKKYLVNLRHIASLNPAASCVCLTNGEKLDGSREGIRELRRRFREMYGNDLAKGDG